MPAAAGRPQRIDYAYRRQGTANLFLCIEPLAGWRHVEVTAQRTAADFARQMKALVDVHYPAATAIAVVLDSLSTHSPAALYQTFPPEEARRLLKRLDFHYTPKHGSWLNMAELEFSVLGRQSEPSYPQPGDAHPRDRGLASPAQCQTRLPSLALHPRPCPNQTAPAQPRITPVAEN
jgi:hypothetical protein